MMQWRQLGRFFGFGLMAVLLFKLDWQPLFDLLKQGQLEWLLLSVVVNTLFFVVKGVRWRLLLSMIQIHYPWRRAIPVYMAGSFLGAITPGRVADLVKASYLHQDLAIPYGQGIASVIMDRLLDLLVLAGMAVLVLALGVWGSQYWLAVVVFCGIVLLLLLVLWKLPAKLPFINKLGTTCQLFYRPALLVPLLLSLLAYALLYGGGFFLAKGIGLPVQFFQVVYVMTLGNLVGILPLSIAGIGTRDLAMIILFQELNIPLVESMAFSMGYLLSNLLLGNLPGCLYWFWQPVERFIASPTGEKP
ncbi:MAG: flippase-like domain-containing protein [Magnetococcales bacterium]|nr:flippase-like domain-containing protein [Magnetococcales bacterium]NGZ25659.1 flippase-like domain-containing protein [Magnetococcales bacterium]